MNTLRFAILVALLAIVASGAFAQTESAREASRQVFVAADGDDAADGLSEHAAGQSGPVRSLERARDVLRSLRGQGDRADGISEIVIAGGIYRLSRPLVLDGRDSGSPGQPVIYRAKAGADVRISGGVQVGGWVPLPGGIYAAGFDPALFDGKCPTQLFVNGARRQRPRLPAEGTFAIGRPPAAPEGSVVTDHFFAQKGDLPSDLKVDPGTEIVILDAWTASRMYVAGFDAGTGRVGLAGRFAGHGKVKNFTAGLPYYIENPVVNRFAPGNWRCDLASKALSYVPLKGEDLATATVILPQVPELLSLRGTAQDPVHDLRFEQLNFEYGAWVPRPDGWAARQSEVDLPAAIEAEHCRAIALAQVGLSHVGGTGIGIRTNCIDVEVGSSVLDDIGGGGIAIGSSQSYPAPGTAWERGSTSSSETHHIRIAGNRITRLGRVFHAGVGIWSGQAHHVTISNNFIHDLFYSGISVGWSWNSQFSLSHHNLIEGNVISKFGQGMLSDLGGIYVLGRQDETRVVGNKIFGGLARTYGGHGLYADEGSAGITFSDNVISDTSHAAIHIHYGKDLLFNGNVATDFKEAAIRCTNAAKSEGIKFVGNMFFNSKLTPFSFGNCKSSAFAFDQNVEIAGSVLRVLDKIFSETNWRITSSGL